MATNKQNAEANEKKHPWSNFFNMVIDDKKAMRDYIVKHGTIEGFKSANFEFAKPI